jgi:hypothetical protein
MRVEICVTEQDIKTGTPGDELLCPIALAIKRHFPDYLIAVGKNSIFLEREEPELSFISLVTTYDQWRFVRRFDAGKPVKSFSFKMTDPFSKPGKGYADFENRLGKARERASKR